jgi:phosphate-selective porin OprO/OprP
MRNITRIPRAFIAFAAVGATAPAQAATTPEIEAIRQEIRALELRLNALEKKETAGQASSASTAAPAAAAAPKVTINDRGYTLASGDSANSVRIRGLVQLDARFFSGDGGIANNAFVLRRARLISEGQFARNYGFQLLTEFGGSSVSILDANLTVGLSRALQFKLGKFKTPVGHELLQSDSFTFFNERSLATNLVPNRELGIQASGEFLEGTFSYQLGVFNGLPDAGNTNNTDFDNGKDIAGRLIVSPFKRAAESPLRGLSFGMAGSEGRTRGVGGRTPGYRTDGQQTFFTYNPSVVADGDSWRISPQLDYRFGPFGALGEYVESTVNLRPAPGGPKAELTNRAWNLTAAFVLTGEASSYNGVVPKVDFDLAAGTWGALEVVARYASLKIDDAAFPLFAAPATSANEASALGLGFNWYLSKSVVFKIDHYDTKFGQNALAPAISAAPLLRQNEQAFISRFQLAF